MFLHFVIIACLCCILVTMDTRAEKIVLDKILFSSTHGPKVEILDNGTVARRYEGYCYSICFSDRPLKVGETLHFNITEIEMGWLSNLNVGVIYTSPDAINPGDLVTCDDNATASFPDSEIFIFEAEHFYSADNIYEFRVDENGTAYLTPNVTYDNVVFTGVDVKKPFWAMFNVFGDTKAVKLLGTSKHGQIFDFLG